jgi:transposase
LHKVESIKPYSLDLRERSIQALQSGASSQPEIAEMVMVSLSCVEKLWWRYRWTGRWDALPPAGGSAGILARLEGWLRQAVARQPDVTLDALRARLRRRKRIVKVSVSMLCRELRRLQLPRKKKTLYDSQRDTPRVQALRADFRKLAAAEETMRFIFIDESGLHLGLTRRYGRAAPGERVVEATPDYSGPHYTMVAALGRAAIQAPFVFQGAMTSAIFATYVEHVLAPTLQPGDIVVLDNLSAHKSPTIHALLAAHGARLLFLAPYSSDFNPIELAWAKTKTALRGTKARTMAILVTALAAALRSISVQDMQGWFKHCGYTVQ